MGDPKKVDVAIQIYGKPWQSLCSIFSLIQHSGNWIDTVYILEEPQHPFGDSLHRFHRAIKRAAIKRVHRKNTRPSLPIPTQPGTRREDIRYQWAIEQSDKTYIFISHNDVLYHSDVIGAMLSSIGESIAIGEIGQCWNCPALHLCGGGKNWNNWNPSLEDIQTLRLPHIRTKAGDIDPDHPKLMPECRVNEWAILLNREACIKEREPCYGFFKLDIGTEWFKAMHKRGYTFKHYQEGFERCYFSTASGYATQKDRDLYLGSELRAKAYFESNFQHLSPATSFRSEIRHLPLKIKSLLSRLHRL